MDSIAFPSSATVRAVERVIDDYFIQAVSCEKLLVLDFSNSQFIEIASLVCVIALIKDRCSKKCDTKLKLPVTKKTLDFLRVWEFPRAVADATELPFENFLLPDDNAYYQNALDTAPSHYLGNEANQGVQRLLSNRFFAFCTFRLNEAASRSRIVADESKRWQESLVRSVLDTHLRGPSSYFGSRVVYESLMNALRHPKARIVQMASHFSVALGKASRGPGTFTIVFWDDGNGMIDTLSDAIQCGKLIDSGAGRDIDQTFSLSMEENGTLEALQLISSHEIPNSVTPAQRILLALTFPGVTSDAFGREHVVDPEVASQPLLNQPGMGLSILLNTVIDIFGGSISFRTGSFFMNIKRGATAKGANAASNYQAKIIRYKASTAAFRGNMLTVRIPIVKS